MFESVRVGSGKSKGGVLVVGQFKGKALDAHTLKLDPDGCIAEAAKRKEATGECGRIVEAFPCKGGLDRVLIVGLGDAGSITGNTMRNAAAAVGRRLAQTKDTKASVELAGALSEAGLDSQAAGSGFGEGLALIAWTRDQFRGTADGGAPKRTRLSVSSSDAGFSKGLKRGIGLGESANVARTLSETPPNICTPLYIAAEAQKLAKATGMSCRVIKGAQLEKEKLTGLINVGKASDHEPCLIRLEYTPAKPKRGAKTVVLVGKTMTYDSGGLSIKVGGGMRGMKRDKDGGCGVFGAMHAIATVIKPKVKVVALLAAAENAISDEAYRPDDIITFRNGVSVEVTNTDAEGRLVLADGLCWACEKEKPGCVIDVATLTGGVVVALGSTYAGLWCDDEDLRAKLDVASDASGERLWRLPHHQEYRDLMKSDVADILNSAPVRKAHPIQGAAFLSYFVESGIPWAHIDIAGVHAVEGDTGPYVKASATGFGARLLAEYVDAL